VNDILKFFKKCLWISFSLLLASAVSAESKETLALLDLNEEGNTSNDVAQDSVHGESDEKLWLDDDYEIQRNENPSNPCDRKMDAYKYERFWYDDTQAYINSRFCEPALWFDNFFSNDRIFNEGVAGTYIRWRNDFIYDEEDHFEFKTRLTASVTLPGMKKRLRLTFEGEEDEDLRDIAPGNREEAKNSLGLQLDLLENARSKFNVSVSLSPRIRFRYRYTLPLTKTITLRLTQDIQKEERFASATTRFDFEKVFDENFLFRSTTQGEVSEEYDGVDWLQAFVLFQRWDKKSSLAYEASVRGISEPISQAIDYRVAVRFRKNFHRKWLFFELSPEMTWPVTYDGRRDFIEKERRSKWQLFFRLEVHFGNSHKKRYVDYNKIR